MASANTPQVVPLTQRARDAAAEAFERDSREWGRIIGSLEKMVGKVEPDRWRDVLTVLAAVRICGDLGEAARIAEVIARQPRWRTG